MLKFLEALLARRTSPWEPEINIIGSPPGPVHEYQSHDNSARPIVSAEFSDGHRRLGSVEPNGKVSTSCWLWHAKGCRKCKEKRARNLAKNEVKGIE